MIEHQRGMLSCHRINMRHVRCNAPKASVVTWFPFEQLKNKSGRSFKFQGLIFDTSVLQFPWQLQLALVELLGPI